MDIALPAVMFSAFATAVYSLKSVCVPPPYVLRVFAGVQDERADGSSALSALTFMSIVLFAVLAVVA